MSRCDQHPQQEKTKQQQLTWWTHCPNLPGICPGGCGKSLLVCMQVASGFQVYCHMRTNKGKQMTNSPCPYCPISPLTCLLGSPSLERCQYSSCSHCSCSELSSLVWVLRPKLHVTWLLAGPPKLWNFDVQALESTEDAVPRRHWKAAAQWLSSGLPPVQAEPWAL